MLSGAILDCLRAEYQDVKVGRWRKAVGSAFLMSARHNGSPREMVEMLTAFRFEPDAYALDVKAGFLHFFEIEVYNPMTTAKLKAYGRLMMNLNYYGIEFAVLVVNKYGHINTVDLLPYYALSLSD